MDSEKGSRGARLQKQTFRTAPQSLGDAFPSSVNTARSRRLRSEAAAGHRFGPASDAAARRLILASYTAPVLSFSPQQ